MNIERRNFLATLARAAVLPVAAAIVSGTASDADAALPALVTMVTRALAALRALGYVIRNIRWESETCMITIQRGRESVRQCTVTRRGWRIR